MKVNESSAVGSVGIDALLQSSGDATIDVTLLNNTVRCRAHPKTQTRCKEYALRSPQSMNTAHVMPVVGYSEPRTQGRTRRRREVPNSSTIHPKGHDAMGKDPFIGGRNFQPENAPVEPLW